MYKSFLLIELYIGYLLRMFRRQDIARQDIEPLFVRRILSINYFLYFILTHNLYIIRDYHYKT